ncbi:MAG TPA: DUF488 domain-containing protein [Candidatus Omnitrophota bacterium]|nr:DUF488 domain-containing protein [Candidatus Omnitrophota bacterium]
MPVYKLYTVGHSDKPLDQFIRLLKSHTIKQLVDVRTIPRSRHNPQFNKADLSERLRNKGIGYRHMKQLGGLRHTKAESQNLGWENLSFRGFADYMETDEFAKAIEKLKAIARKKRTAIMCAEAVPWRCHRSLIADALTYHHWKVFHIMSFKSTKIHKITSFLHIFKGKIAYPRIQP